VRRWLPLLTLASLTVIALAACWSNSPSLKMIGLNYEWLRDAVASNLPVWVLIFMAAYAGLVTLSLPGASLLTMAGGLLLGWQIGACATVVSATIGATLVFLIARGSLETASLVRLGDWLEKLRHGFCANALSYLLFLRLVPVFPFVIVNLAAAVLGVPLRTYVVGTFFGIIPATVAYSMVGAGLGSAIEAQNRSYHACLAQAPAGGAADCPYAITAADLVPEELVLGLVLLGVIAIMPVALKKWRLRNATA
jgi:uncharacterized membrane protein YdjX (TVP38/TMEM64 family)